MGKEDNFNNINVDNIETGSNPRQSFDGADFDSLVASIKEHKILQPLLVNYIGDGKYSLIAGERRLRAAKKLGHTFVPCFIQHKIADDSEAEKRMIENEVRADLTALERGLAIKKYIEQHKGMAKEDVAKKFYIDRTRLHKAIKMTELPGEVWTLIQSRKLSDGHAEALLPLIGKVTDSIIVDVATEAVNTPLTVSETRALVKETLTPMDADISAKIEAACERLSNLYGDNAKLVYKGKDIVFTFKSSIDDIDDMLEVLGLDEGYANDYADDTDEYTEDTETPEYTAIKPDPDYAAYGTPLSAKCGAYELKNEEMSKLIEMLDSTTHILFSEDASEEEGADSIIRQYAMNGNTYRVEYVKSEDKEYVESLGVTRVIDGKGKILSDKEAYELMRAIQKEYAIKDPDKKFRRCKDGTVTAYYIWNAKEYRVTYAGSVKDAGEKPAETADNAVVETVEDYSKRRASALEIAEPFRSEVLSALEIKLGSKDEATQYLKEGEADLCCSGFVTTGKTVDFLSDYAIKCVRENRARFAEYKRLYQTKTNIEDENTEDEDARRHTEFMAGVKELDSKTERVSVEDDLEKNTLQGYADESAMKYANHRKKLSEQVAV